MEPFRFLHTFARMSNHRTIQVCPGIGDNLWLLMKLINSGEKFRFQLPGGNPRRGKQIFELLPQVSASAEYVGPRKYQTLMSMNIQKVKPRWSLITEQYFTLTCNEHLERGRRLEDFLPDLQTSFRLDYNTKHFAPVAEVLMPAEMFEFIGIYGSSYSTSRAWGFWDEHRWLELIRLVYHHNPNYCFVIIGASWDLDLGRNLVRLLDAHGIPYVNTIGQPLGVVVEVLKRLRYFFSFPSGLGILAPSVGCPVTMFYPKHLERMMNAWASPEDIETGAYKGCQFCEPGKIFKWAISNKKI